MIMTKYKCKGHFLWFTPGQVVEDVQDNWKEYFDELPEESKIEAALPPQESVVESVVVHDEPEDEDVKKRPYKKRKK
jgi:predicted oxidoreductase (fatty acid repression mutant protein)